VNKQQLIDSVSERANLTKKDAEKAINAVIDSIKGALNEGDKVALVGFGTFEVRTRAERSGRNPQTGEQIKVPGGKVPAFKPGKELKESV